MGSGLWKGIAANIICIRVLFCICEVSFYYLDVSLYEVDCHFEFVHV